MLPTLTSRHRAPQSQTSSGPPLAARLVRSLLITFSVAQWCRAFLAGASVPELLLITFAWASTINLHLIRDDKTGTLLRRSGTHDGIGGLLAGQLLWLVPLLRTLSPDHWFWHPVHVPPLLIIAGMTMAGALPMATIFSRLRHNRRGPAAAAVLEFDLVVLCTAVFLTTGTLLWAAATVSLATPMIHRRLKTGHLPSVAERTDVCAIAP